MARISLFINRLQYLDQNWTQNAFNSGTEPNPNFHAGFQIVFWLVIAAIVGYIIREIITHLGSKGESKPAA